jgi:hypothetical protein
MDIPQWATAITFVFTIAFPLASLVSVTWIALAGQKRTSEAVAVQQNHEQRMALLAERFAVSRTFTEQRYAAYALVLREVQMARQKMDELLEEKKAAGKTSITLYQGDPIDSDRACEVGFFSTRADRPHQRHERLPLVSCRTHSKGHDRTARHIRSRIRDGHGTPI